MGVMHGYEIDYVFGRPLDKTDQYTSAEIDFSKTVMEMFATFAKIGSVSILIKFF